MTDQEGIRYFAIYNNFGISRYEEQRQRVLTGVPSDNEATKDQAKKLDLIGKIQYDRDNTLGRNVFRGTFEGRQVAVKRILKSDFDVCERELELLRKTGEDRAHENIARFFCSESNDDFYYLALELGQCTVDDWLRTPKKFPGLDRVRVLKEIAEGLNHLHELGIVHRDIKPQNILLSCPDNKNRVRAMITDFGLSKKLKEGQPHFSMSGQKGSQGWMAPEVLKMQCGSRNKKINFTLAVDIFSLGCVFYYVLKGRVHPYGEDMCRDGHIKGATYRVKDLNDHPTAMDLISRMIGRIPDERPTITAVLNHPMFWSCEKVLTFFQDTSDRLNHKNSRIENSELVKAIESESGAIFGMEWLTTVDSSFVSMIVQRRFHYNYYTVKDLLRCIRNAKNHYQDLPQEAQDILGPMPDGFHNYFTKKFPELLIRTWHVMRRVKAEHIFEQYYTGDQIAVIEQKPEDLAIAPAKSPVKKFFGKAKKQNTFNGAQPKYRQPRNKTTSC